MAQVSHFRTESKNCAGFVLYRTADDGFRIAGDTPDGLNLRYALSTMASRNELQILIDQIPEEKLDLVKRNLEDILRPPAPDPAVEKIMQRAEEFQAQFPERLKLLQAGNYPQPGGFSAAGGFGWGPPPRRGNGEQSYSWWEGRAHIMHRLVLHEGHEMDIVDRLYLTADEKTLVYLQEVYAEGHSVRRNEEFPVIGDLP